MIEPKSPLYYDIKERRSEVIDAMGEIQMVALSVSESLFHLEEPSVHPVPITDVQFALSAIPMLEHHLWVAKQSAAMLRVLVGRSATKARPDLYATCCIVHQEPSGLWGARIEWQGPERPRVEGAVMIEAPVDTMAEAIDIAMATVNSMGLPLGSPQVPFALNWEGDGEDQAYPVPDHWKAILKEEADRRGWETYRS